MKIMVSACLLGYNCKYNGQNNYNEDLVNYLEKYEIIPVCPEVMGGLPCPRKASEIKGNLVINSEGKDVSEYFIKGAYKTLDVAKKENIQVAILKERSPSCGSNMIYDGSFQKKIITGMGVTAKLLQENGMILLNEENYKEYLEHE